MKRLFTFFAMAIVAMAVVSCDKDEDIIKSENNVTSPDAQFLEERAEYSNYDVNAINELLCNKTWYKWSWAKYDKDWNFVEFLIYKGEHYLEGLYPQWYTFAEDGTVKMVFNGLHDSNYAPDYYTTHGTWVFDPETRVLDIILHTIETQNGNEQYDRDIRFRIEGIGKDVLYLDEYFDIDFLYYKNRYEYIVEK